MSEHLSDLVLDEVAVGGPAPAHLEACAACVGRLERLRTHAQAARTRPGFARVRAQVRAEAERRRPVAAASRWRLGWFLVPALASVAVALLVVRSPPREEEGMRVKGAPGVELVRLGDGQVADVLREGDEVALRLRGVGHRYALVVSVDAAGQVEALWPATGEQSGELTVEHLAPLFQVTRGDFVVHAFYSDAPLALEEVRGWLEALGPECAGTAQHPECLVLDGLPEGVSHAAEALVVEERR